MTNPNIKPFNYIRQHGAKTLFNGITPMMLRRGTDWCIRYYGVHLMEKNLNKKIENMSLSEKMMTGFIGGALSGITIPIDTVIAKTQEANNSNKNAWEIMKNTNAQLLCRGFWMKVINAGHHTAIVVGLGDYIYNKLKMR